MYIMVFYRYNSTIFNCTLYVRLIDSYRSIESNNNYYCYYYYMMCDYCVLLLEHLCPQRMLL